MNIGELRGILGDAVSNEVRTLELKVGQVVRGVVTQQLDNNEAIVNINGVHVRAKLEIPLLEGQPALMQVQPESKGSYILLKQVDPTTLGLNDPMKDILKAMGLPDKQWAVEVVRQLRAEGIALNKETTSAFQRAIAAMPPGTNMEQWIAAATIALRRGLPMTEATILSINQLTNGSPIHTLMEQLRSQLQVLLQGMSSQGQQSSANNTLPSLVQQLSHSVDQGQQLIRNLMGQTELQAAPNTMNQQSIANQGFINTLNTQAMGTNLTNATAHLQQAEAVNQQAVQHNSALGQLLKWLGVDHEMALVKQLFGRQEAGAAVGTSNSQAAVLANTQQQLPQNQTPINSTTLQQAGNPASFVQSGQGPTSQVTLQGQQAAFTQANATSLSMSMPAQASVGLQAQALTMALQAETPHTTAQSLAQANIPAQTQDSASTLQQQSLQNLAQLNQAQTPLSSALPNQMPADANIQQGTNDSLKASLLQLLQQPEISPAVKETAQQLLHAITGQQLMLATERNNAMFSHMMMYIPLQDQDGSQTAKVHIQTRRDRKGAMDADNCRIVFDLNMNALGATLVDVHITSKVISLHVWNDHPAIHSLVDQLKPTMVEALSSTGYTLSSLRTTPLIERNVKEEGGKEDQPVQPPIEYYESAQRYKGVDFKA